MWTHLSLNVSIVWDDALWRTVALWQETPEEEPVVLEKSGRVSIEGAVGPDEIIARVASAIAGSAQPYSESRPERS